jgi:hypothetical protein
VMQMPTEAAGKSSGHVSLERALSSASSLLDREGGTAS